MGSRAWGLNSPTSDYDVKFIYVRRLNWYFGVEEDKRDVIDDNSAFDMNGWDIRKALQLLRESNCGVLEWLNSSHLYRAEKSFLDAALEISKTTHCRRSLVLAYWGKASKHYREYILTELKDGTVYLKKYLFVIQAILSCRFSLLYPTLPPHDFATLLESFTSTAYQIPSDIHQLATELMIKKRAGNLANGTRYKYLGTELEWIQTIKHITLNIFGSEYTPIRCGRRHPPILTLFLGSFWVFPCKR